VIEIALFVLAAWVIHSFVLAWLRRLARRRQTTLVDALVSILDSALRPILLLAVVDASLNLFELRPKLLTVSNRVVYLSVLAVGLYYAAKMAQVILAHMLEKSSAHESIREPIRFLTSVVFAAFGVMIVLDNLGISLTAVWTTLGVGSVAIALALQDTLSNFFAGFYLRLDNPIHIGDYVKIDSDHEGFIVYMGWRSARIRTLPNNIIVVPNTKLASAIITNFSMPEPQMSLLIPVSVSYDCDPSRIEGILVEEAMRAAGKIEGFLADPAPFVRFIPGFGESSLDFTLICRVNTYVDQYLVQHELRKRIFARFRQEGIAIPYPQRDVHIYGRGAVMTQATSA
jgi:small-conductance mechanosensitive channel